MAAPGPFRTLCRRFSRLLVDPARLGAPPKTPGIPFTQKAEEMLKIWDQHLDLGEKGLRNLRRTGKIMGSVVTGVVAVHVFYKEVTRTPANEGDPIPDTLYERTRQSVVSYVNKVEPGTLPAEDPAIKIVQRWQIILGPILEILQSPVQKNSEAEEMKLKEAKKLEEAREEEKLQQAREEEKLQQAREEEKLKFARLEEMVKQRMPDEMLKRAAQRVRSDANKSLTWVREFFNTRKDPAEPAEAGKPQEGSKTSTGGHM